MLTSILGARLSWHQANGWVFEPVNFGPDIVDYHLKEGPHAGRHAIQHFYYQRVAPGVETTVWDEESGALVHIIRVWVRTWRSRRTGTYQPKTDLAGCLNKQYAPNTN